MTLLRDINASIGDGPNLDAFSRLRVSNPANLWETQCQYSVDPIQMESAITGTGTAAAHSANTRMVALAATAGAGTSLFQSYLYIPYQASKSQFFAITGVMGVSGGDDEVEYGFGDDDNGLFYRQNTSGQLEMVLRSSTSGSMVETIANRTLPADAGGWNIDAFDGTGPSGLTLDVTKAFIFVGDLQYLGMGRCRLYLDINGILYPAHEFLNANVLDVPYMQTATLPIRCKVTTTTNARTAHFKCAAVNSEGGFETSVGNDFSTDTVAQTVASGGTHMMTLRPKTSFNSITNRAFFRLEDINVIVTGNDEVFWEIYVGAALAGASWADVNGTYSGAEIDTAATLTLTNAIRIGSGYVAASNQSKGAIKVRSGVKYPITLDAAGANRDLGQLTLRCVSLGANTATQAALVYNELR